MRIAILDANPRICGPMSWSSHLRWGFHQLGYEAKVVSATKSGRARSSWGVPKWGGQWSPYAPDLCVKFDQLAATLDSFDMVVLPEPKVPSEDKDALKKDTVPPYVQALLQTRTPFITALHGNDYYEKDAPFAKQILAADAFCGVLVSHSSRSSQRNDLGLDPARHLMLPLPYVPRREIKDGYPTTRTVGTTGRFMFNKGPQVVALAAQYLPPDVIVELWGSASTGLGTNVTFNVYEGLLPKASNYKRYGDQEEKAAKGDPAVTEHGNTIRPFPWDIRLEDGPLVRYLGNYTDPVYTATRLGVHVNLTGYKFSGGLVEFSTLEAMDAGSLCITPNHVSDDRYKTMRIDIENPPGSMKSALERTDVAEQVGATIAQLLDAGDTHPDWRQDTVHHNRKMLRWINDPKMIAQGMIEAAL